MKQRCYNKNLDSYHNYGGRGIIVCDEWKDNFLNFYYWAINNGYSDTLTIDRINVDGNYEPGNCRWSKLSGIPKKNIIERLCKGIIGEDLLKPLRTRLNFDIATKIRNFYKTHPDFTYKQIAEKFNVKSSATISDILNNKSYHDPKYVIMEVRDN